MYGLRRVSTVPHRPSPSKASLRTGAAAGGAAGGAEGAGRRERVAGGSASYGMSRKQRALSLLFLVLLPYLRTKLHALGGERSERGSSPSSMGSVASLHGRELLDDGLGTDGLREETRGREGASVAAAARVTDGRAEGGAGEEEADGQGRQVVTGGAAAAGSSDARGSGGRRSGAISSSRSSARGSRRWRQVVRALRWVQRRVVRGAAAAYPWVQAPYEGLCLLYQLLYVMDATPHCSPILHLLSLSLRRATPQELAEASSSIATRRQREFGRLPGPPVIRVRH
ncbi:unnamed protein product [Closterium sp. Yama58-4]|nr:unnamed protein product [Closterium sp. Yama58-4]